MLREQDRKVTAHSESCCLGITALLQTADSAVILRQQDPCNILAAESYLIHRQQPAQNFAVWALQHCPRQQTAL